MKLSELLKDLGTPVLYYAGVADFLGSVNAALLFCDLAYWSGKQKDPKGWIYKVREEIAYETGLSRAKQEVARKLLVSKGYLKEQRRGYNRKLYYKPLIGLFASDWNNWLITHEKGKTRQRESRKRALRKARKSPSLTETTTTDHTKNYEKEMQALNMPLVKKMKMPNN